MGCCAGRGGRGVTFWGQRAWRCWVGGRSDTAIGAATIFGVRGGQSFTLVHGVRLVPLRGGGRRAGHTAATGILCGGGKYRMGCAATRVGGATTGHRLLSLS